jgi:hypothetical protein
MKHVLTIAFVFSVLLFSAQTTAPKEYLDLIRTAETYFIAKDYKNSALAYSVAFKAGKYKIYSYDFYNAGCAWALAGNPDSAFVNLNRIVNSGVYKDYNHITNDFDLISLRQDKRWLPLIKKVLQNNEKPAVK